MRDQLRNQLQRRLEQVSVPPLRASGKLTRLQGSSLEAAGFRAEMGANCEIAHPHLGTVNAEVVGFRDGQFVLMPSGQIQGLLPGARVTPLPETTKVQLDDSLLGRVVDGLGNPLDEQGMITGEYSAPLLSEPINPLKRGIISQPLDVGIRAINGLLTIGRGQRVGLMAGSGLGKSVLLGMVMSHTQADVIVVALIGERGREVREFIHHHFQGEARKKTIVVASPADHPPLSRLQGAYRATRIAEHFRDQGKQVLLLFDSLTRFAQAKREIGLSAGEPPTTRGYPASVFSEMPRLVERAGVGEGGRGAITAIYTVLAEGDDWQDPVVDSARAILDGHILLSRNLADQGHYPAIDIERSVSRVMSQICSEAQLNNARSFKQLYSLYRRSEDLIRIGAYTEGHDPELDRAIKLFPAMTQFLQQKESEAIDFPQANEHLAALLKMNDAMKQAVSVNA